MAKNEKNILILGIGNTLLSDEGAGVRVIEELTENYHLPINVTAIDGGTMGLDLLPYLDNRSHVFIVDAVLNAKPPGSIFRIELSDPPAFFRQRISPHQLGLADVLGVAALTGCLPPEIILYGIEPKDLSTGIELSMKVEEKLGEAAAMLVEELRELGIGCEKKGTEVV